MESINIKDAEIFERLKKKLIGINQKSTESTELCDKVIEILNKQSEESILNFKN